MLADEIHADLVYAGHEHVPFASLGEHTAARTITATSATKAFNIAGLRCAVAHVGHPAVKAALDAMPPDYFGTPSILSRVATIAAWRESDAWLGELLATLTENRHVFGEWAAQRGVGRYHQPEGTYLAWFRPADGANAAQLARSARVALSDGAEFAQGSVVGTSAFVRLNFATSRGNLETVPARPGS